MQIFRPATLTVSLLTATAFGQATLFEFEPAEHGGLADQFGASIAPVGDFNGDGYPDLMVGAPLNDAQAEDAGSAFVYSGFQGEKLMVLRGQLRGGNFGRAVAGIGDVDGDGRVDLLIGAPGEPAGGVHPGRVHVRSGLDGSPLLIVSGEGDQDRFGQAVAGVGDVNGDGVPDFVVGAPKRSAAGVDAGAAYLVSGLDGTILWQVEGGGPAEELGFSVAGLGDVDGDGVPDVAIGSPRHGSSSAGRVRVHSGSTGAVLYTLQGAAVAEFFGYSVASLGDVDGDGFADLAVGAPGIHATGQNHGGVRVYSGASGALRFEWIDPNPRRHSGWSIAGAGDFDGDLVPDLLVGARYGPDFTSSATVRVLSGATVQVLVELTSGGDQDSFGQSVSGLGDLNGDGLAEFAVGAPSAGFPAFGPGAVRVYLAGCPEPSRYCFAGANSTGIGARIGHTGGPSIALNPFELTLADGPPGEAGLFYYGTLALQMPFGDGFRCVGGNLTRLGPVQAIDASGSAQKHVDFTAPPAGSGPGAIPPGSTRRFQFWYRDLTGPLASGFNLSDALSVTFCP